MHLIRVVEGVCEQQTHVVVGHEWRQDDEEVPRVGFLELSVHYEYELDDIYAPRSLDAQQIFKKTAAAAIMVVSKRADLSLYTMLLTSPPVNDDPSTGSITIAPRRMIRLGTLDEKNFLTLRMKAFGLFGGDCFLTSSSGVPSTTNWYLMVPFVHQSHVLIVD